MTFAFSSRFRLYFAPKAHGVGAKWSVQVALWLVALMPACTPSYRYARIAEANAKAEERSARSNEVRELKERYAQGRVGTKDIEQLAHGILELELEQARSKKQPFPVALLHGCRAQATRELETLSESALESEASLASRYLIAEGKLSSSRARSYENDPRASFRSLAAYTFSGTSQRDRETRRRFLVDSSANVREAAAEASFRATDPSDEPLLWETARLEPSLSVRVLALRTLALITQSNEAAAKFQALYDAAGDEERNVILSAWLLDPTYFQGGRERILRVLGERTSGQALEAASLAFGLRSDDAALKGPATSVLSEQLREGPLERRRRAIRIAPLAILDAQLVELRNESSKEMQFELALALHRKKRDAAAAQRLLDIARDSSVLGREARRELARDRDLRVQTWLEEDLRGPTYAIRLGAARSLAMLGRSGRALPLLLDTPTSNERIAAACTILGSQ
jgi:hypothetical protein